MSKSVANSFNSHPQFPQRPPGDAFRGILLVGPSQVQFSPDGRSRDLLSEAFADLVVFGSATFDYNHMGLRGRFTFKITFFATDQISMRMFSGRITAPGIIAPPEIVGVTKEDGEKRILTRHFNPNIISVLGIPPKNAIFDMFAQLGESRSNVVTVQMISKEG